ncbi:MAG: TolC family outer membrane protein [Gammaproteobacteria bacterium]|nr:TolC family outer membrane protein [Gammaproteobacteria bacterium]
MKKYFALTMITLLSLNMSAGAAAANLLHVYEDALSNDPVYQQAIAQRLSDKEAEPLNLAPLLPQAVITGGPALNKQHFSGSASPISSTTSKGYLFTLALTQAVFDFGKFAALSGARAASKEADATLNAASQNLILRVAQAYFNVLKDEDNLAYSLSNKKAYAKQYDQANQEFKVGLKTKTDVYTAESSYAASTANAIAAETTLAVDKETLRAITNHVYSSIAPLSEKFPLISPQPADMDAWVKTALMQNWSIKAAQLASVSAMETIKQQRAGHFPTLYAQGSYSAGYNNNFAGAGIATSVDPNTTGTVPGVFIPTKTHTTNASLSFNLGIPLSSGGAVIAGTNQAKYNYQVAMQNLEKNIRETTTNTRQTYLNIMAGIQKIRADKQAIKSAISSYEGIEARYQAGTETLVDVLNQQRKVYEAQTYYTTDRYAYVYNILALKQAAGTLSQEDLVAINSWLGS